MIDARFQGLDGIAQGGHVAGRLSELSGRTLDVRFRRPIPLERQLTVSVAEDGTTLADGATVLVEATPGRVTNEPPPPVGTGEAESGRLWARRHRLDGVRGCFSCGSGPESFGVHAGRVADTRLFATPFVPPAWTAGDDGTVRPRYLWAALDCAAGWRVTLDGDPRPCVTGSLVVEVYRAPEPGEGCVVVADANDHWEGRTRRARSALYTGDGALLAASESLWVALVTA